MHPPSTDSVCIEGGELGLGGEVLQQPVPGGGGEVAAPRQRHAVAHQRRPVEGVDEGVVRQQGLHYPAVDGVKHPHSAVFMPVPVVLVVVHPVVSGSFSVDNQRQGIVGEVRSGADIRQPELRPVINK